MKRNIFYAIAVVGLLSLFSCDKDEVKTVVSDNPTSAVMAPLNANSLVSTDVLPCSLTFPKADSALLVITPSIAKPLTTTKDSLIFSWTAANFGFSASVNYKLQIAYNDAVVQDLGNVNTLCSLKVSVLAINKALTTMNVPANVPTTVTVRAVSTLDASTINTVGEPIEITVIKF